MVKTWTRPEDSHLVDDSLVRDAKVVGGSTLACNPKFIKNVLRTLEVVEELASAETPSKFQQDVGIPLGIARRIDGAIDLDDPALCARACSFLLIVGSLLIAIIAPLGAGRRRAV